MPPINPQMVTLNCWVGWWNPHVIEIFKGYQTQFRMFIIMFYITSTHKTNVLPHSFGYFAIFGALGGCRSSPHFRPTFVCRSRIPLRAENGTPVWCLRQGSDIHNIDIWFKTISILRYIMIIEGSLEVKLPTIWTDEKQSRAEAERSERLEERRVEEKESEERRCRCAKR